MFGFLKKLFGGADIKALLDDGAIIVDVRTKAEYKNGHVSGSLHMPLQVIDKQIKQLKKYNKPIITCCASGRRSGVAATRLKAYGLEAYNGGSWTNVRRLKE
ncbi:MAG: rhodanese-like domain-containing protein [Saprospiraceae bacterium]|nr:rhodanese-like domain-containing protein [Saprospiraceae bacterium]MCB9324872.1 rhodanese-like domain-containing protein [Lewinellaceae bacterium]